MTRYNFSDISIRGRVAFSISCFENALVFFGQDYSEWRIVLEKMWSYTSIEFFDDWHYSMAEYLPESILECTKYEEDFEYVDKDTFEMLYKIYTNNNKLILDLVRSIFDIGISELYGKLTNHGQNNLVEIEKLIKCMKEYNIPLPDIHKFNIYSYNDAEGWGNGFDGLSQISILKNI